MTDGAEESPGVELHPIPGFPGYFATRCGQVWSGRSGVPRKLKVSNGSADGYPFVGLTTETGKRWICRVHRVIALTFLGPTPPGLCICHEDDNKLNCRADNLSFGTHRKNHDDAVANGKKVFTRKGRVRVLAALDLTGATDEQRQALEKCVETLGSRMRLYHPR